MVAGRVHLRLGQGRDAILGPRPSLLETSILPRPVAHLRYLPSIYDGGTGGVGRGGPLPSRSSRPPPAGRPDGRSYMPCSRAVQPAADSRAQSLHSAMTLPFASACCYLHCLLCTPMPYHSMPRLDRTVVTQTQAVFTGTVLGCCTSQLQLDRLG